MTIEPRPSGDPQLRETDRWSFSISLLFLIGLGPILLMAYHVQSNWVPLPCWDEWFTPGSQFESWCRGTLTLNELFSLHNESRKFFPRLLYFALLKAGGGWDVRKEITVLFLEICLLSFLLWRLLRQTPGNTLTGTVITWAIMMFFCFSPVQFENFLWGIQIEPFFIGLAVVAAVLVNLSALSFPRKALINGLLGFVATYTYANGMLLWPLVFPIPGPGDSTSTRNKIAWSSIYLIAAASTVAGYFVGYHAPPNHPNFASLHSQGIDLVHYVTLLIGSYLASDPVDPFIAGCVAIALGTVTSVAMLVSILRGKDWRPFYPWIIIGIYAVVTGIVTAVGRLGLGLEHATDVRYRVFSLAFYLALIGGGFALYCTHFRSSSRRKRVLFLMPTTALIGLTALCWIWSYQKNVVLLNVQRQDKVNRITALKWIEVIPDNPDLKFVFPFVDMLKHRVPYLVDHQVLRLPLIGGQLAEQVRQSPSNSDGSTGEIEKCVFDSDSSLSITGWAWLPARNRRADLVVIGGKDSAGIFKPVSVLRPGGHRQDLFQRFQIPKIGEAGFSRSIESANLPSGDVTIQGWAIDLLAQQAWPLAGSITLSRSK